MIQITRLLAKQLRSIIKRTFNRQATVLTFRSGDDGLFVEAQGVNHALRYHDPQPQDRELLLIPINVLEDVQGAKPEPVFLNTHRAGVIGASWQEKGVFHDLEYDAPEPVADAPQFPELPAKFNDNQPELLAAMHEAYETTDVESKRYALACVQARGNEGVIAATDGRQMLKQAGFSFGFEEKLLLQHTKFFANKELPSELPVQVGELRDDKGVTNVVFQVGGWTYWLGVEKEGRFPDIDQIIPSTRYSKSTLQLSPADAKFLVDNLHRLPNGNTHREVTIDLNGSIILRATSISTPRPAEMILRNSSKQGDDIRICTDRNFLARAAAMGFSEIHLPDNVSPAVAQDANRTFLWMLLDPKEALKPTDDCLRIESPLDYGHRISPPPRPRKETPVNRITPSISQPQPAAPSQPATQRATQQDATAGAQVVRRRKQRVPGKATSALEQAISLRDQLREVLASSKELIASLQTEKRSQKSLKLALDSLKQLQNVA